MYYYNECLHACYMSLQSTVLSMSLLKFFSENEPTTKNKNPQDSTHIVSCGIYHKSFVLMHKLYDIKACMLIYADKK